MKTYVIVNPNAAGGLAIKKWPTACEMIEKAIGAFDYEFTNAQGVASMLTAQALKKGYEKIVAVGGDGTLNEVIQGLFKNGKMINPEILIGTIPLGSGTDFARTLKLSHDLDEAIRSLKGQKIKKIDIGSAEFSDHQGDKVLRYFINMADVGIGGEVAERANTSSKMLGGFGTYLYSSLASIISYKPKKISLKIDGEDFSREITSVFIANGEYCGGGMHIAPEAVLDNGKFEVVLIKKISKWDLFSLTPKIYSGKLKGLPIAEYFRAESVEIKSDEKILINLDGEQPGITDVTFKIIPRVLNFMC